MAIPLIAMGAAAILLPVGVGGAFATYEWVSKNKEIAMERYWNIHMPEEVFPEAASPSGSTAPESSRVNEQEAQLITRQAHIHSERVDQLENQVGLQYEPLNTKGRQIRLIHIEPPESDDDPIRCSLQTINLDSDIPYLALSYCWGSTTLGNHIFIDDRRIDSTQNLYDALRELRARGCTLVWVDMICINQGDPLEKAKQIEQMTLTYSRAHKVISWLGKADDEFLGVARTLQELIEFRKTEGFRGKALARHDLLFDLTRMWIKEIEARPEVLPLYRRTQHRLPSIAKLVGKIRPRLSEADEYLRIRQLAFLQQLGSVVRREYWERAWILQEITVAGSLEVFCGTHNLDFDTFAQVLQEMEVLHHRNLIKGFTKSHQHIVNLNLLRAKWQPREPIYLLEALRESCHTKATKEKDKIYSLFGVCFDSSRFVTEINYEKPLSTVIRQMTETSIRVTKSLDIICIQSPTRPQELRLPSWAPDWRLIGTCRFNHRMIKYLTGQDNHPKQDSRDRYWKATANSRCTDVEFLDENRILRVKGYSLGAIYSLSAAAEFGSSSQLFLGSQLQNEDVEIIKEVWRKSLRQRIFETLTVYKEDELADDHRCDFRAIWDKENLGPLEEEKPHVYWWLKQHEDFAIASIPLKSWANGLCQGLSGRAFDKFDRFSYHATTTDGLVLPLEDNFNARKRNLRAAVNRVLEDGLRLMEMGDGDVGWAHPSARCGDIVVLLQGCTMPVILRQSVEPYSDNATFTVIGDAYVSGAMYGEYWTDKDRELHSFHLR